MAALTTESCRRIVTVDSEAADCDGEDKSPGLRNKLTSLSVVWPDSSSEPNMSLGFGLWRDTPKSGLDVVKLAPLGGVRRGRLDRSLALLGVAIEGVEDDPLESSDNKEVCVPVACAVPRNKAESVSDVLELKVESGDELEADKGVD